jgi:hypothetical protein
VTPQPSVTPQPTETPVPAETPPPANSCLVYGVDDQGDANSQLFTFDPQNGMARPLGVRHDGLDLEGLDIDPTTSELYATSGKNGVHPGSLYRVDRQTGAVSEIGPTGFGKVSALSFRPTDATLWGWAAEAGLIQIDKQTGKGTVMFRASQSLEDITWNNDGTLLYGVLGRELWMYAPADESFQRIAKKLPGETEAREMRPDGRLVGGVHNASAASIFVYDLTAMLPIENASITTIYKDIEGIAWPSQCTVPI